MITTEKTFTLGPKGYWEIRMRIPSVDANGNPVPTGTPGSRSGIQAGFHLALWLLPLRPTAAFNADPEYDICEAIGNNSSTPNGPVELLFSNIVTAPPPVTDNRDQGGPFGFIAGTTLDGQYNEFITYGLEVNDSEVIWTRNGDVWHRQSRWPGPAEQLDTQFYLLCSWESNFEPSDNPDFPGIINANTQFPAVVELDYIRVYEEEQSGLVLDPWTQIAGSTLDLTTGANFSVSDASNRIAVVAIAEESSNRRPLTVTFGGEQMTRVANSVFSEINFNPSASIWILKEADIAAIGGSGQITAVFDGQHDGALRAFAASYKDLNQVDTVSEAAASSGTAAAIAAGKSLDSAALGRAIALWTNAANGAGVDASWTGATEQIESNAGSLYASVAVTETLDGQTTITPSSSATNDNVLPLVAFNPPGLQVTVDMQQALETDTAQAISVTKIVRVGKAFENDTAQAVLPLLVPTQSPLSYANLEFFWVGDENVTAPGGDVTSWVSDDPGAFDLTVPGGESSPPTNIENGIVSIGDFASGDHLEVINAALDNLWAGAGNKTLHFAIKLNSLVSPAGPGAGLSVLEKRDGNGDGWQLSIGGSDQPNPGALLFSAESAGGTYFVFFNRSFVAGDLVMGSLTWNGDPTSGGNVISGRIFDNATRTFAAINNLFPITTTGALSDDAGGALSVGNNIATSFENPLPGEVLGMWFTSGNDISKDDAFMSRWINFAQTVINVGQAVETDTAIAVAAIKQGLTPEEEAARRAEYFRRTNSGGGGASSINHGVDMLIDIAAERTGGDRDAAIHVLVEGFRMGWPIVFKDEIERGIIPSDEVLRAREQAARALAKSFGQRERQQRATANPALLGGARRASNGRRIATSRHAAGLFQPPSHTPQPVPAEHLSGLFSKTGGRS